jgi:8-amino-7-oxononanoate synthase
MFVFNGIKRAAGVYPRPRFTDLPAHKSIAKYRKLGRMLGIPDPFFRPVEGRAGTSAIIDGGQRLNFAWCDYLGFNQHAALSEAAAAANNQFGTCVSASRMVAGQTSWHDELETEIADFLAVESALLFVSGHAANVSTIATLMSEGDLVIHDEYVHNSAIVGTRLSGARAQPFQHNNLDVLEALLSDSRGRYRNALIIAEGLYSTEGDTPNLARLIEIKERYGAWLMIDDAHGLGVLGDNGRGAAEHCGVDPRRVDIWMGTLSKTLASCGGYIAGDSALIDILRYTAPGFVYSVGLPPAMTATALAALRLLRAEPQRVARLHANGKLFLEEARKQGLDTASSAGLGMVPVIVGDMVKTAKVWHRIFSRDINPSLIIYPGVPVKSGRLRYFLTAEHSPEEIRHAVAIAAEELSRF